MEHQPTSQKVEWDGYLIPLGDCVTFSDLVKCVYVATHPGAKSDSELQHFLDHQSQKYHVHTDDLLRVT